MKLKLRRRGTVEAVSLPIYTGPVKRTREARNVRATIALPKGVAYKDFVAGTVKSSIRDRVEAAAGWPPGSMVAAPNFDDASLVDIVLADPRILNQPVMWEGPSWTGGASIADSISIGMYQDGTECEVEVPASQIQIMGQVGSGKSLGGAWNALGEMITRPDCIVWAIDIKKGLQTLGPLVPGLHRVATTPMDAIDLLRDADNLITPRTNYLSSEGLGKWFRGCGLKYLVVWIEEAPYVMNELGSKGIKAFSDTVKAARSAGITVAWSLQRADFTELPTKVRDQATKWCFGVQDARASKFGLSKVQIERGCQPEMWGQRMPGMSYIDAPNITEAYVAQKLRAWYFGDNDSLISAHAKNFPWQERKQDEIMVEYFEAKARGETSFYDLGKRPDANANARISTPAPVGPTPDPLKPATIKNVMNQKQRGVIGRKLVDEFILRNEGKHIRTRDLLDIVESLGLTRPWINLQLNDYVKKGKIVKHKKDRAVTWEIVPNSNDSIDSRSE
jgi:hypothetical protein